MDCPKRVVVWLHEPDGLLDCIKDAGHDGLHSALNPYHPDGEHFLSWMDDDRRQFEGEFVRCPRLGGVDQCVLPAGHNGHDAF